VSEWRSLIAGAPVPVVEPVADESLRGGWLELLMGRSSVGGPVSVLARSFGLCHQTFVAVEAITPKAM
jgi:hypothetical protein